MLERGELFFYINLKFYDFNCIFNVSGHLYWGFDLGLVGNPKVVGLIRLMT